MKQIKEGLRTYCVFPFNDNEFFLNTEYRIIRENEIPVLVPLKLRETDNSRELYYDISGRRSLVTRAEEKAFSLTQCRSIVRGLLAMMDQIRDYLLEPEYICYDPECVFFEGGRLYFLYGPVFDRSVQENLEDLFSFMLSKVDYEDAGAVKYIYQIFWAVKRQGFSADLLEKISDQEDFDDIDSETHIPDLSGRKGFSQILGPEPAMDVPEKDESGDRRRLREQEEKEAASGSRQNKGRSIILITGLFLVSLLSLGFAAAIAVAGYYRGFTEYGAGLMAGALGLFAASACGVFFFRKGRERKPGKEEVREYGECLYSGEESGEEGSWKEESQSRLWKERSPWQEEKEEEECSESSRDYRGEGTMILSQRKRNSPMLKSLENGAITFVRECPFYIGSDPVLNQMILIDKTISRQHAVILEGKKKNSYRIKDLGSTNGTFVKGIPVHQDIPDELEDGCVLCFAQKKYRFIISRDVL